MKSIILICAICLQLGWSYGAAREPKGIGAFAYTDSNGQRNFYPNIPNQRLASDAAWKAFDLTSNQAGYIPNFAFRSPFSDFPGFAGFPALPTPPPFPSLPGFNMPMPMPNLGDNSAFAGAALTPGFSQQIAAISPGNPNNPNVNKVNRFADSASNPGGNFYSVSSSSYAKSSDIDGEKHTERGANTYVNKNGEVTSYSVRS